MIARQGSPETVIAMNYKYIHSLPNCLLRMSKIMRMMEIGVVLLPVRHPHEICCSRGRAWRY